MGAIQSGINQLFSETIYRPLMIKAAKGVAEQSKISKYQESLKKAKTPEERYTAQQNAPSDVSQKSINKYIKENPKESEEFLKASVKVDEADAQQLSIFDDEIQKIVSEGLATSYTPVSIGNSVTAEEISKSQLRRKKLEENKRLIEGLRGDTDGK